MIDFPLVPVKEGKTEVLVPDLEPFRNENANFPAGEAPVFYNKRMEINRDLALAALRVYKRKIFDKTTPLAFCEPMAGTGIRSVRVANEIENCNVIINDKNPHAVKLIKKNITHLHLESNTEVFNDDANELIIRFGVKGKKFDMIDLDPFGSPAHFLDATVQGIEKNGLLAVTSTDMATMCGVYPQACIRKYASMPIHTWLAHELALRMQLGFLTITLARHRKYFQPLFVQYTAHFIRTYVLCQKGITAAKKAMKKLGYIAHCKQCLYYESNNGLLNQLSPTCPKCGHTREIGGPFWLGKMYKPSFITDLLQEIENHPALYGTAKQMKKILQLMNEEANAEKEPNARIGFYDIHEITAKINTSVPKLQDIIDYLREKEYVAHPTHIRVNSIKTNASLDTIQQAIKTLLEQQKQ
ncbi:MAG: tRNA (guanine(10)-N(2))-dimethyltransferase [Asgard group archaeon]|nr:tRNA (guanine(10)-N(2))-dimethyltransferase [Asgard group archaeon]